MIGQLQGWNAHLYCSVHLYGRWGGGKNKLLAKSAWWNPLKIGLLNLQDSNSQHEHTHLHNNLKKKVHIFKPISAEIKLNALQFNLPSFESQADPSKIPERVFI